MLFLNASIMSKKIILFGLFSYFLNLAYGTGIKGYSSSDSVPKPSFDNNVEGPQFSLPPSLPYIAPPPAPVPEPPGIFRNPADGPPMPYSFGYEANAPDGRSTRQETSDGTTVRGSYTIVGADGINRIVHYIADGDGFRASIITNEPGTEKQNPSGIIMETSQPKAEELARKYGTGAPPSPASTYRQKYAQSSFSSSAQSSQNLVEQSQSQSHSASIQSLNEESSFFQRPKYQERLTQQQPIIKSSQVKAPRQQITLQPFSMPQPIKALPKTRTFQQQSQQEYAQRAQVTHQAQFASQRQVQSSHFENPTTVAPTTTVIPNQAYFYRPQSIKGTKSAPIQAFAPARALKTPPRSYLVSSRRVSLPVKRHQEYYSYVLPQAQSRPAYVIQRPARLGKISNQRVLRPFQIDQKIVTEAPTTLAPVPTTQSTQQTDESIQQLHQVPLKTLHQTFGQPESQQVYSSNLQPTYF